MFQRLAKVRVLLSFAMLAILLLPGASAALQTIDAHLTQAHLPADDYGTISVRVDNPGNEALNVTHLTLRVYQTRSFTNASVYTDLEIVTGASRIAAGGSGNYSYMMLSPYGVGKWSCDIITSVRLDDGTNLVITNGADLYGDAPVVWPETLGGPVFFILVFALVFGLCAMAYYAGKMRWSKEIEHAQQKGAKVPLKLRPYRLEMNGRLYLIVLLWAVIAALVGILLYAIVFHWF